MTVCVCFVIICALILDFISHFDDEYIYEAMAMKPVEIIENANMILSAKKSIIDLPAENIVYTYTYDNIDNETESETSYDVISMDLSRNPEYGEILLTNETAYNPDLTSLLYADYPIIHSKQTFIKLGTSTKTEPLVLILHTHATEAFYPLIRSNIKTESIVAIGSLMTDILNNRGVSTIHCDIMHDEESYLNSYNRSKDTVLKYLEEYPSIKYVFDIHRDAVIDSNGNTIKGVTTINGLETAQVMTVVGTDYKGGDHPNWQDNLNIAVKLQTLLNNEYPNIARPINIRSATFNAQYAPGSLLLEIGSSGNTLTEAKRAAIITAEKLADLILTGSE